MPFIVVTEGAECPHVRRVGVVIGIFNVVIYKRIIVARNPHAILLNLMDSIRIAVGTVADRYPIPTSGVMTFCMVVVLVSETEA